MKEFIVYQIKVNDVPVYIGRTQDIDQREKSHKYDYSKGKKKKLYDYLREIDFPADEIYLEPIDICKTKAESKRKELFYITLYVYFRNIKLFQHFPNIKDSF